MNEVCGLVPVRLSFQDEHSVWMVFVSEEAEISRSAATADLEGSHFSLWKGGWRSSDNLLALDG